MPHQPPRVYRRCSTKAMQSAARGGQCCFIHARRRQMHGPTSDNPHGSHAPGDGPLRWDAPIQNPTRDTCCPTTPHTFRAGAEPRPCKVPPSVTNVASYMQREGIRMVPRPTTPRAYMHREPDHSGGMHPCRILQETHAAPPPTRLQPVRNQGHAKCRQVGPMLLHTCNEKAFAWSYVQQTPRLTSTELGPPSAD